MRTKNPSRGKTNSELQMPAEDEARKMFYYRYQKIIPQVVFVARGGITPPTFFPQLFGHAPGAPLSIFDTRCLFYRLFPLTSSVLLQHCQRNEIQLLPTKNRGYYANEIPSPLHGSDASGNAVLLSSTDVIPLVFQMISFTVPVGIRAAYVARIIKP